MLWDPATGPPLLTGAKVAAEILKVEAVPLEARGPGDVAAAYRSAVGQQVEAVLVLSSPVFSSARKQIAEVAATHRMPTIMPFAGFVDEGGLISYGPNLTTMFQQAGSVMAKILLGTRPGEIPIEPPARFELIVNLRTARTLGLTMPNSVLVRADRIVE